MKRKKGKLIKVILIILGILLGVVIIFLLAFPPVIMKDMVDKHVDFDETDQASDYGLSSEELTLTTSDDFDIKAYEVYVEKPKGVIICISGIHAPSVTAFYGHSKLFSDNGYASILMDMRSHGGSEGDTICLGYKEYMDTQAVVDYIKSSDKYNEVPIIVFGISMGGSTAINSIGEIEEIDALISSSAFSSWDDTFYDNMVKMGVPRAYASVQKPFVKIYTSIKYGLDTVNITPEKEIMKLGDRPALIMHSIGDTQVPFDSYNRIMENAPEHVQTWTREGDYHFIVNQEDAFEHPEQDVEYANKIIGFLDDNFGQEK